MDTEESNFNHNGGHGRRQFSLIDLGLLAVFSVGASFATLGVSGLAALAPLAIVLRPFGLSYEVAVPLMIIIDPLAEMVRTMLNVAINCMIPTLARGRATLHTTQSSMAQQAS
jgi:L-cystine uptake protein TcyP (sodium:dicarboxylate symporter family)